MKIADCAAPDFDRRLAAKGIPLPCGPYVVRIVSSLPHLASALRFHYADFELADEPGFIDFEVRVDPPSALRRILRPQVSFTCDGRAPFQPLPLAHAFPMLEWGLNWVISSHTHDHLVLHAAVLERDGRALILSADPGSGKSTLCAALVQAGWRLLSDELTLLDLESGQCRPIARPISLKNESIEVVRALGPQQPIGAPCFGTSKGTVAHLRPPASSVAQRAIPAMPAWVVFPRFGRGHGLGVEELGPAQGFMELARHSFNYSLLGEAGFAALARLVDTCSIHRIGFGHLDQVLPVIERLRGAGTA